MKFIPVIILIFAIKAFSVTPINYYWIVNLAGDNVSVKKLKSNYDSIQIKFNAVCDTMNSTVPRWHWFTDHSKIFPWMNIDTIAGKVIMDTVKIDSIQTRTMKYTGLVFSTSGDSCMVLKNGVPTLITAANLRIMIGAASTVQLADSSALKLDKQSFDDSLNDNIGSDGYFQKASGSKLVNTGFIESASGVSYRGSLNVDSYDTVHAFYVSRDGFPRQAMRVYVRDRDLFTDYLEDSIETGYGNWNFRMMRENRPSDNWTFIQASDGGDLYLNGDSGRSVVIANNHQNKVGVGTASPDAKLDVAGRVIIDSLLTVDSLSSTKGISATIGRFTGAIFGTSGTLTGTVGVDSLNVTKRISAPKGITTNNRDTLAYEDTTFYDSLFIGASFTSVRVLARTVRVGSVITHFIPELTSGSVSSGQRSIRGIPSKFLPSSSTVHTVVVLSSGTYHVARATVSSTGVMLTHIDGLSLSGESGLIECTLTWVK